MEEVVMDQMSLMSPTMRTTASPPIRLAILALNLVSLVPKVSTPTMEPPQGEHIDVPLLPFPLAEPREGIPHALWAPSVVANDLSHALLLPLEQVLHLHQGSQPLDKSEDLCLLLPEVAGTAPLILLEVPAPLPPPPSSLKVQFKSKSDLHLTIKNINYIIGYTSLCHAYIYLSGSLPFALCHQTMSLKIFQGIAIFTINNTQTIFS